MANGLVFKDKGEHMAILKSCTSFEVDESSKFGGVKNGLLSMSNSRSATILRLPDFSFITKKVYSEVCVLDTAISNDKALVLVESNGNLFIEASVDSEFQEWTRWQLELDASENVEQLFAFGSIVIATGPNAKRSVLLNLKESQKVNVSQTLSISALSQRHLGIVTDIYGTGGVLKIYRRDQALELEEIAELSSRGILFTKRVGERLFLTTTDNVRIFVSEIDVAKGQLISERELSDVECLYLNNRFKLLGGSTQFFAYPSPDYAGLTIARLVGTETEFKLDFEFNAYDAACFDDEGRSYICAINEQGKGILYESEESNPDTRWDAALDFAKLNDLELSNASTETNSNQLSRMRKLGLQ